MDVKTKLRHSPEYLALLGSFPLRPIHGDAEHQRAIEIVNSLLDRPALSPDQEDYLDVLGLIIADYEDSIYEHPEFSPVERLHHLMEEHGLSQGELARRAGVAVKSLSDVFAGKRRMSTRMREKIAECFGVSADFFS
jgi:HTH-type transcriptional regulator / antitoxin HigA